MTAVPGSTGMAAHERPRSEGPSESAPKFLTCRHSEIIIATKFWDNLLCSHRDNLYISSFNPHDSAEADPITVPTVQRIHNPHFIEDGGTEDCTAHEW